MDKLKEWSETEAETYFKQIENTKGKNESYNFELKETLCWDDTSSNKTNTTQRAFSGLANTYGGQLIIGFKDDGNLIGTKNMSDIDNHIVEKLCSKLQPKKREYITSLFKAKNYTFKDKTILVIFIKESLMPIQCDNGVYYYREQSQFKFMPHSMLEDKFRKSFEEEKNIYLIIDELEHITNIKITQNQENRGDFKIDYFLYNFLISQNTLYYFYKRNNLLVTVKGIMKSLRLFISLNKACDIYNYNNGLMDNLKFLLKSLKDIQDKRYKGVIE